MYVYRASHNSVNQDVSFDVFEQIGVVSSAFTFSNQIHKGSASEELPNDKKEVNSFYAFIVYMSKQFSNMYNFCKKRHE